MAYNIGRKIPKQKHTFIGVPGGPKKASEILHIVDFHDITDPLETLVLMDEVLRGAQDAGISTANITFINVDEMLN